MNFQLRPVGPPAGSCRTVPAVEIHGHVDATNSTDLSNALRELASPALIIDLSLVDYFDSAGFAMIDRLLGQAPVAVVQAALRAFASRPDIHGYHPVPGRAVGIADWVRWCLAGLGWRVRLAGL